MSGHRPLVIALLAWTVAGGGVAAEPGGSAGSAPPANGDCLTCHGDRELTGTDGGGGEISVFVDEVGFARSTHAGFACVDCHQDATLEHGPGLAPVACASCHTQVEATLRASAHGPAKLAGNAACLACHGEPHQVLAAADSTSPTHRLREPEMCGHCHSRPEAPAVAMADPIGTYARTVHGRALLERGNLGAATCTDCHTAHAIDRAGNPASSLHRSQIAATCGHCHSDVAADYTASVHGRAIQRGTVEAATCTDCHGEHTILAPDDPASTVFATKISAETCARCHGAERLTTKFGISRRPVATYRESYHGLAAELGGTTVANCASCHGVHDILPPSDPRSAVNPANLPMTCGKCHPGVSEAALTGLTIHGGEAGGGLPVRWVTRAYQILIPLVIGIMLLHHGLDFGRKLRRHVQRASGRPRIARWSGSERREHWILFVAFVALAYSGFAIRSPHATWAAPFRWLGGEGLRSVFHRVFAIVFIVIGTVHVVRVVLTARGQRMLRGFAFHRTDPRDLRRFLGGASLPEPHEPGRFTYMAKVEYWALVWGAVIMTLTGAGLVFKEWTLAHLPSWMPEFCTRVHFYEALLATLAILVWHLYRVIFNPDVYPLEVTMLPGGVQGRAAKPEGKPAVAVVAPVVVPPGPRGPAGPKP